MSDQGVTMNEDAEIQADLETQGLADLGVTVDDVKASFGLFESMEAPSLYGPSPSPADGEDFRYTPEPGEESLFSDTSDMFFPPEA